MNNDGSNDDTVPMNQSGTIGGTCVLVVDDDPNVRKMLVAALLLEGYDVVEARDGMEALATIRNVEPDVMVIDLQMPRLSGLEVLRRHNATPTIVLSASDSDDDIEQCYALGVRQFLQKPVEADRLLSSLAALVLQA